MNRFFDPPAEPQTVLFAAVAALLIAWFLAQVVRRVAARGLRALLGGVMTESSAAVRGPLRLVTASAFLLALALVVVPVLEIGGMRPRGGVHLRTLAAWTFGSGLRVALIAVLAYVVIRASTLVVRRFEHDLNLGTDLDAIERGKRARTLGSVIRNVTTALVFGIALLMILRELGLEISPVLTGAGIVGVALGFGAQTLVRDIISGFFLILEDQVRVGDAAAINGTSGLVEAINLRTIILRDAEGTVHVFPNGAITTLANRSKEYSYYVIDVPISYDEDPERVRAVLSAVGQSMERDDRFGPLILEPMDVMGVESFTDWAVQMKLRIKTVPLKQWEVGRELRRRILKEFAENGIEMPSPRLGARPSTLKDQPPPASAPGIPGRS
jgi:moderate conductance mechanosensitive channel